MRIRSTRHYLTIRIPRHDVIRVSLNPIQSFVFKIANVNVLENKYAEQLWSVKVNLIQTWRIMIHHELRPAHSSHYESEASARFSTFTASLIRKDRHLPFAWNYAKSREDSERRHRQLDLSYFMMENSREPTARYTDANHSDFHLTRQTAHTSLSIEYNIPSEKLEALRLSPAQIWLENCRRFMFLNSIRNEKMFRYNIIYTWSMYACLSIIYLSV